MTLVIRQIKLTQDLYIANIRSSTTFVDYFHILYAKEIH